uniref:Vitellogenin S2 n=1 Tax=Halocynthia roretzi TaxID=7729 RepID=L0N5J8_HALRO|nr:vitellogenin S2 [Halocynthia roretzi]
MNATYSHLLEGLVNMFDWSSIVRRAAEGINVNYLYNLVKDCMDAVVELCSQYSGGVYDVLEYLYLAGRSLNEICFNFMTYMNESYSTYSLYEWMQLMVANTATARNCNFGVISTTEYEQAVTFNNNFYNLPKRVRECDYLLAGDIATNTFSVVLSKNNIIINLPGKSLVLDPEMQMYEMRGSRGEKYEITLPHFDGHVRCIRTAEHLTCQTPHVKVIAQARNGRRFMYSIHVAETVCNKARGLMGIGGDTSMVPKWMMMNGKVASTYKEFINSYSTNKACLIETIPVIPAIEPTPMCKTFFNSKELNKGVPALHAVLLEACESVATNTEEACIYANMYVQESLNSGYRAEINPECAVCKNKQMRAEIERVDVTLMIALSGNTHATRLEEVVTAVRNMANTERKHYNIRYITFGGRGEMHHPYFSVPSGRLVIPAEQPWTLPRFEFNGMKPTIPMIKHCIEFAYRNSKHAIEGVANMFLFVMPEEMEIDELIKLPCVENLEKDLAMSYVYIPNACETKGAHARSPYGVRKLVTKEEICARTPEALATDIANPYYGRYTTCTCTIEGPFPGMYSDNCKIVA